MLEKMMENQQLALGGSNWQENRVLHHIIPRHSGGPDLKWNLVAITEEEHRKAHKLRFEAYSVYEDEVAFTLLSRSNNSAEALAYRARLAHAIRRAQGTGFSNPSVQAELGRRGGLVKSPAKDVTYDAKVSSAVATRLSSRRVGTRWRHPRVPDDIVVAPVSKDYRRPKNRPSVIRLPRPVPSDRVNVRDPLSFLTFLLQLYLNAKKRIM